MEPQGEKIGLSFLQLLFGLLNCKLYFEIIFQLCRTKIGISILIIILILGLRFRHELKLSTMCRFFRKGWTGSIDYRLRLIDILWDFAVIGFLILIPVFRLWDILSFIKIGSAIWIILCIGFLIDDYDHKRRGAEGPSFLGQCTASIYNIAVILTKPRVFLYLCLSIFRALLFEYPIYAFKFCWNSFKAAIHFCYSYRIDQRLLCAVCKEADETVLVAGCNHFCLCHRCAQMILNQGNPLCPMCQNPFR